MMINKKIINNLVAIVLLAVTMFTLVACTETNNNSSNNDDENTAITSSLDGVVILQAYGVGEYSTGGKIPALSHSFIELYNTTSKIISLDGSSIQYAKNGSNWSMLKLAGSINPKTSFLIRANEYGDFVVSEIVNYDMSWDTVIDNKQAKFCLVNNTNKITTANPYNVNGSPISGYIDMLAICGTGETMDAGETKYLEGQSKQKSARRNTIIDNNNNASDFSIVDYSEVDVEIIDYFLPKTSKNDSFDPCSGRLDIETSTLMFYEVYGTGNNTDTPVNRSFVTLYNGSEDDIDLSNYQLYYKTSKGNHELFTLSGTIKANSAFTIVGKVMTTGDTLKKTISDSEADLVMADWVIDNKVVSLILLSGTTTTNDNVDEMILSNAVDILGVNSVNFETMPVFGVSKQKSVRRIATTDSNNNSLDYEIVDYRL